MRETAKSKPRAIMFIKCFRIVGYLEGLSYLLLIGIGVPLKHLAGNPLGVRILGMPHGLLFIAYIVLAWQISFELKWSRSRLASAVVAALLPFGTFLFDKKVFGVKP